MQIPDLSEYAAHRVENDAAFEGVEVPGLRAEFFRRPEGERVESVGRYTFDGRDLLLAWGYVDEEHCRHNAVVAADGCWQPPVDGCPQVELITDGQAVVGLAVRSPSGEWVRVRR
ncbi:hypothetical protein ACTI_75680 [Actinoplanes sp. OR16]|nr:hypothetical protein ACTI_75680 [Actinoplanes sp. OR16]